MKDEGEKLTATSWVKTSPLPALKEEVKVE